jgi:hypothetical protein
MKNKNLLLLLAGAGLYLLLNRSRAGVGAIKKTRFMPVYINGKVNPGLIRSSVKKPGVYLIKVNGNLKYIGYSSTNVYKTLTRHFQSWEDPRQVRVTYPRASYVTARVIYTTNGGQAARLEKALIIKYKPEDNPNKYANYVLDFEDKQIIEKVADVEDAPF